MLCKYFFRKCGQKVYSRGEGGGEFRQGPSGFNKHIFFPPKYVFNSIIILSEIKSFSYILSFAIKMCCFFPLIKALIQNLTLSPFCPSTNIN